jgi:hypothetical protein
MPTAVPVGRLVRCRRLEFRAPDVIYEKLMRRVFLVTDLSPVRTKLLQQEG